MNDPTLTSKSKPNKYQLILYLQQNKKSTQINREKIGTGRRIETSDGRKTLSSAKPTKRTTQQR
jgi:hypothetical protein